MTGPMSDTETAVLPPELQTRINDLAKAWGAEATEPPEQPDGAIAAAPRGERVRITGWKRHPARRRKREQDELQERPAGLRCSPVDPSRNPWYERQWETPKEDYNAILHQEAQHCEWHFRERAQDRMKLPIADVQGQLLQAVSQRRVVLVAAETGSGKSTQVPQYLLDDAARRGAGGGCHVVCTQPRRLAALSLAERVSWERGGVWDWHGKMVHGSVGHVVRWDERPPRPWGSICFCTVGALLPRLARLGASHIIVDEAHTRDVHTDLLLTVLPKLLRASEHLRVIVMSATFDVHRLQAHFGGEAQCAIIEASGRPHSVREYFLEDIVTELSWRPAVPSSHDGKRSGPRLPAGAWDEEDLNASFSDPRHPPATLETVRQLDERTIPLHVVAAVLAWIATWRQPGGVLVFLPGWQEIQACADMLGRDPALQCYEVVRLHSTVPGGEQQRALWPSRAGRRKAILSTDIAETSITVPDVLCVVDSGVARLKVYSTLEVQWASQANIVQRAGRAGRVQDGICVHLFTRARFERLPKEPTPEMRRVSLEEVVLAICDLELDGEPDSEEWYDRGAHCGVTKFLAGAPDPPEDRSVKFAFKELQQVGALDKQGYITHLGALIARLPLTPRLGAALLLGGILGAPTAACAVAAALSGREPWARRGKEWDPGEEASAAFARGDDGKDLWSDAFAAANALRKFESEVGGSGDAAKYCANRGLILPVMQQMSSARRQLHRVLAEYGYMDQVLHDEQPQSGAAGGSDWFLEEHWPLMRAILTFAYGWNLGVLVGGKRVQAGWRRQARLARSSVLVDPEPPPPSGLIVYEELAIGNGGRVLLGATYVTQYLAMLFGGRQGMEWEGGVAAWSTSGHAILDDWLRLPADPGCVAALGQLQVVTRTALQYAAEYALRLDRDFFEDPDWKDQVKEWQACVRAVAQLPPPRRIMYVPYSLPLPALEWPAAPQAGLAPEAAGMVLVPEPAAGAPELPIGWAAYDADDGRIFYARQDQVPRWERPAAWGPDGNAQSWRWVWRDGVRRYVQRSGRHEQEDPPQVGDAVVLPEGWEATWDPERRRHYYWRDLGRGSYETAWNPPAEPAAGGGAARRQPDPPGPSWHMRPLTSAPATAPARDAQPPPAG